MDMFEVGRSDPRYSSLLAHVTDAPSVLYCRGNAELLKKPCFAIVGSRRITPYGADAVRHLTHELVRAGFVIVSGLAMGIDAAAHRATLDAEGATIAVLGSGVDDTSIAPQTNLSLAHDIIGAGGLVLSEYPSGTEASYFTFPQRNRIISGLSRGIAVVEADEKSGALITARCAADQGRDVFAVPGSIFSPRSRGTHALIQKGAKLVMSAQDILDEYDAASLPRPESAHAQGPGGVITSLLEEHGTLDVDALVAHTGIAAHEILATLALLELNGTIVNTGAGTYRLNT